MSEIVDLDLDALERLSAELHAIYQAEAHRQYNADLDDVRHPDDYEALEEHVKEYDRVLARFIMHREDALIQRLREAEAELLNQQQLATDWQQRIVRLERVREAAQEIEVNCGILYDRKFNTVAIERMQRLRAALAAAEAPRLTETPTAPKGGK